MSNNPPLKENETPTGLTTTETKRKRNIERVLEYDARTNLLLPVKWKHPFSFKKRDYLAIVIGLDTRFEFERFFCEKIEFESEHGDSRQVGVGFKKENFMDDLVLEERYSYKEGDSFITRVNYFKITILDDGVYGEPLSKSDVREHLTLKQQMIYDSFKQIMKEFGAEFTMFTMRSILNQKERIAKKINFTFFEQI